MVVHVNKNCLVSYQSCQLMYVFDISVRGFCNKAFLLSHRNSALPNLPYISIKRY